MTGVKKGDRVRVTFEAVLRDENSLYASFSDEPGGKWVGEVTIDLANIEKIEPPVEVFKPGDVVRHSAHIYALTPTGFVVLDDGVFYGYGEGGRYKASDFTSETFDRVEIAKPR